MLEIEKLLYQMISERILRKQKLSNKSVGKLAEATDIDRSDLYKIIKGVVNVKETKTSKKRAPHYLNDKYIEALSVEFNIDEEELIWGNKDEKERFIKIIIISILMNSNKINPFENTKNLDEWFISEQNDNSKLTHPPTHLNEDKMIYEYFVNKDNAKKYNLLNVNFDTNYEKSSNRILKLLLQYNYRYSINFIERIFGRSAKIIFVENTTPPYTEDMVDKVKIQLDNFTKNKGNYCLQIVDNKKRDYKLFIVSFETFWENNKNVYLDFFENKIFSIVREDNHNIMKKIKNEYFHKFLTSAEFNLLNVELLENAEYSNIDNILINMRLKQQLQFESLKMQQFMNKSNSIKITDSKFVDFIRIKNETHNIVSTLYEKSD